MVCWEDVDLFDDGRQYARDFDGWEAMGAQLAAEMFPATPERILPVYLGVVTREDQYAG